MAAMAAGARVQQRWSSASGLVRRHSDRLATRRRFVRATVAAAATGGAFGLAACGATEGPAAAITQTSARTVDRSVKETLAWLIWSSNTGVRGEAYAAMTRSFNEQFPNVTVEQIAHTGGPFAATFEKLMTLIAGGERLDLVGVVPEFVPVYMERAQALSDLNAWMRRDPTYKATDHAKGAIDGLTWKGKLAALPVGLSTSIAVYNQDIRQRKGVAPPKADWDMKQVVDLALRLTERKGPEDTLWGYHDRMPNPLRLYTYIWAFGGEPMTPREEPTQFKWSKDPKTLEAVEWVVDLHRKHNVRAGGHTNEGNSGSGAFPQNRVAISGFQINILTSIPPDLRYDVLPMPRGRNGRHLYFWGFCYGLAPQSRAPELAWEFLKHVTGEPGQREWMEKARFAPSLRLLLTGPYLKLDGPPASKQIVAEAAMSTERFPMHTRWPDMIPRIEQMIKDADAGKKSVRDALTILDEELTAIARGG
ncbi:MAG: extracellular solute-binding protein [Chloroflexi bacterium]|nr:extracellular solute-binding protein [Chloroflexota bacterium]